MKKKKKHSQLLLSVEKLRELSADDIKDVGGGMCNTTGIACSNEMTRSRHLG